MHSSSVHSSHPSHEHGGEGHAFYHVVPASLLCGVLGALLVLTIVTVAVSYINLGPFNLIVAMLIAMVKASLVVVYFMHLRWDKPFNAVIFLSTLLFLFLFIGFSLIDASEYESLRVRNFMDEKQPLYQYLEEVKK